MGREVLCSSCDGSWGGGLFALPDFAKVLGEPSHNLGYPLESRRLIYAESIRQDRDPLDLMATILIDGDASEAFFGDRWRTSRDVLADGAEEYLKRLSFD
jgi:hypothetical protein